MVNRTKVLNDLRHTAIRLGLYCLLTIRVALAQNTQQQTGNQATPVDGNTEAKKLLEKASLLRTDRKFDEAIATYTEAAASKTASPEVLQQARLAKLDTEIEKIQSQHPTFFTEFVNGVTAFLLTLAKSLATVVIWIGILFVAILAILAYRDVAPVRQNLLIDLQDLSGLDRDGASRILSAEVVRLLSPSPSGSADLIFESMSDLEGAGSASIRPINQLPELDAILAPNLAVAIGPLQFTPASIVALGRRFLQPSYQQSLVGSFSLQGTRAQLNLAFRDELTHEHATWQLSADGSNARTVVLRKAVANVLLQVGGNGTITKDVRSMECLLEGLECMAGTSATPTDALRRSAAMSFQTALSHDPGNWLARFNLSVLSRQLGQNEFAVQNCRMLEELLSRKPMPCSLKTYTKQHPAFPSYVRYNRALALAKFGAWPPNKAAIAILDDIIAENVPELLPQAQSARVSALLFQFDQFRNKGERAHADAIKEEILGLAAQVTQRAQGDGLTGPIALAYAVALNAQGQVADAAGDYQQAREYLERAAALQPDFIEPHINLGRLYRHSERRLANDWVLRAQTHLKAALDIQPDNRHANYQMGRLQACDAVLNYVKALEYFNNAAPHSLAAFHAGQIYCNPEFSNRDLSKGIEQLRMAANLATEVDFRLGTLAERLLDAAQAQIDLASAAAIGIPQAAGQIPSAGRARQLLAHAQRAIERLATADDKHNRQWAEQLQTRHVQIQQMTEKPPQQGPQPPPVDATVAGPTS